MEEEKTMRYYIDLGMYNGELMENVISIFPSFDKYIGFEPVPELCEEALMKFAGDDRVLIYNKAVSIKDEKSAKFYVCYCEKKGGCKGNGNIVGTGSTLCKNKITANIKKSVFINVGTINFSKYIIDNFNKKDEIVLKIDIEGEEYNLLTDMLKTGAIEYVDKIYCEWHYHKMKGYKQNKEKYKKMHYKLVFKLNKLGFNLRGNNVDDELDYIIKIMEDMD